MQVTLAIKKLPCNYSGRIGQLHIIIGKYADIKSFIKLVTAKLEPNYQNTPGLYILCFREWSLFNNGWGGIAGFFGVSAKNLLPPPSIRVNFPSEDSPRAKGDIF